MLSLVHRVRSAAYRSKSGKSASENQFSEWRDVVHGAICPIAAQQDQECCWFASYQSAATLQLEESAASSTEQTWKLSGHATIAGPPKATSKTSQVTAEEESNHMSALASAGAVSRVRLFVRVPASSGGEGGARVRWVTVSLSEHPDCVSLTPLSSGVQRLVLRELPVSAAVIHAAAEDDSSVSSEASAERIAAQQHLLHAAAFSGILARVEEICSLHLTQAARFDAILLKNPAMQHRLAQLAAWRFGLDTTVDYLTGYYQAASTQAVSPPPSSPTTAGRNAAPLLESTVVHLFGQMALTNSLRLAQDILHGTPLHEAVTFDQPPSLGDEPPAKEGDGDTAEETTGEHNPVVAHLKPVTVDYPFIQRLLDTPVEGLTAPNGSMKMQAQQLLAPLIQSSSSSSSSSASSSTAAASYAASLLGLTSGSAALGLRLNSAHMNLRGIVQRLEKDAAAFLSVVKKHQNASSVPHQPVWLSCLGMMMAELFANVAVLHRGSAAITRSEELERNLLKQEQQQQHAPITPEQKNKEAPSSCDVAEPQLDALSAEIPPHREALLADAFHTFSHTRRQALLAELQMAEQALQGMMPGKSSKAGADASVKSAASPVVVASLEDLATHPIELVMAESKGKSQNSTSSTSKGQSA